jgi:hypothetical protein
VSRGDLVDRARLQRCFDLEVLACASGEQHTLGLITFGIVLHTLGWRITYLGADIPPSAVAFAARAVRADLAVISFTVPGLFAPSDALHDLTGSYAARSPGPAGAQGWPSPSARSTSPVTQSARRRRRSSPTRVSWMVCSPAAGERSGNGWYAARVLRW